ncbi:MULTISPECIES: ABC transporter ATP-binding protein [unclassified Streptomyces]|uniref:ABC transporter ATP-binding protein n=1 Tax=unclassified Streptomyces TaxID=2593676 RepID=UPI00081BC3B5|nr:MULTISPECIES: ABC transporter ATP-binding protein [unclassified Streptomyces]MYQ55661.1 ATP-binding cassette domain-containing protein [Streptomyces sp. SID4941]SCE40716.1 putative ABC transport system ATP-binding protein [Streptomyces sp. PalvLS-984]SDC84946.1 putative ABC transport system ATP-binding protein [Streptomyces sp. AmelKG-A3]
MTPGPDVVIELSDVERTFGTEPPVHALRGVNLTVRRGEHLSIVGPSGSGKSTLLNTLGLLDRPTAGSFRLDGVETTGLGDLERTALRGSRIGFVFQSFHLLPYRTVDENVMVAEAYRKPRPGHERGTRLDRARQALERVGVGHRSGFRPDRLSGGERQRVAIARALIGDPALLLCDEPTGNLDSENTLSVLELFDDLRAQGMTLVLITHDEAVSRRASQRVRITDGCLTPEAV